MADALFRFIWTYVGINLGNILKGYFLESRHIQGELATRRRYSPNRID